MKNLIHPIHLIHLIHLIPLLAVAQTPRDSSVLSPIVVTATRTAVPASSLANGVTVLDGAELRRAGITTVVEALKGVPSLVIAQAGSYGAQTSVFLRGGESDYVRVLIDGVPMNQPGGAIDLAYLTTENVDRIEVVRGPTSVLYGSDAVTGVIQIVTRQGSGGSRFMAEGRGGEHGSSLAAIEFGWGDARAGLSGGLQREGTNGIHAFNSAYDNTSTTARFWVRPDARTDVQLSARMRSGTFHFPTDGSGAVVDTNALNRSRQLAVSLDAGRRIASGVELRALLTGAIGRDSSENLPDSPGDTLDFYSESRRNSRRLGADVRANIQVSAPVMLTAGAATERQRTTNRGSSFGAFGPGSSPESSLSRGNTAAYLQALATGNALSLQAGVRLDDNQKFGRHGTWRAGLSARVAGSTRLRFSGGTAFKEPTFDENFNTAFSTGNPDLKPEQSTSFEAGIEQTIGRASVSVTGFDQRFRNLIEYSFGSGPGGSDFHNIAGARASGVETELRVVPATGLSLQAQHTWLQTDVTDADPASLTFAMGQRLLRRPKHLASVSGDWSARAGHGLGLRVTHVGKREDLSFAVFPAARVVLPDYTLLAAWGHVTLFRSVSGGTALSLTARADNLLGKRYQDVSGYQAPGRLLMIGARVDAGAGNR